MKTALIAACQSADAPTAPANAPDLKAQVIHTHQRAEIIVDDVIPNECSGESIRYPSIRLGGLGPQWARLAAR